jgi:hypothetical protein
VKSEQTVRFGSVEAQLVLELPTRDDADYEETAVFINRRIARGQRKAEMNPHPTRAAATFDSDAGSDSDWELSTVVLPPASPGERNAMPPALQKPRVRPRKPELFFC